jgi:hypothetical protein
MIHLLFILFVIGCRGGVPDPRCYTMPRESLLSCFSELVDTNHDNILTAAEVDSFTTRCCANWPNSTMNPNDYLQMRCDMNWDGVLDSYDWNHRHACCRDKADIIHVCDFCYKNGWTGPPSSK